MAEDDGQARQVRGLSGHGLHGSFTGGQKGRSQQQVFGRIAAQRQFGREQQACARGMGCARGHNDFLRIARQVAHDKIELCSANGERHG
ncbi:hypothetical protein D3C71_2022940 [compost metagenome]